jgi:hypothetical protein
MNLYWTGRPWTAADHIDKCRSFLLGLGDRYEEFSNIFLSAGKDSPRAVDLDDEESFRQQLISEFPKEWTYINPDSSNLDATLQSRTEIGFRSTFYNSGAANGELITIDTTTGQMDDYQPKVVSLRFKYDEIDADFVVGVFRYCVDFWKPAEGCAARSVHLNALNQPMNEPPVGWLTYYAAERAPKNVPPGATTETIGDGVIVRLGDRVPDPDDTEIVESMRLLASLAR